MAIVVTNIDSDDIIKAVRMWRGSDRVKIGVGKVWLR
jgi:hypothetical protein